jgi:hypothetical protein
MTFHAKVPVLVLSLREYRSWCEEALLVSITYDDLTAGI